MIKFLDLAAVTAMHGDEIHRAVARVIDSGWYLHGRALEQFEHEYSTYIGVSHTVGCANGLDALTLMLRAYVELGRLNRGDEIIVPAVSFIATYTAIQSAGLIPVLVEPRADSLQIDDRLIESAVGPRTRAVMLVHLYGRCAYTDAIGEICRRRRLFLFEDNAQAHGCLYGDRRTGSLGEAAAHSFYPGKNLGALGNGGAVTTDDAEIAATVRTLANYGANHKYTFKYRGVNSRLEDIQAAVLSVKLRYLDDDNGRRRAIARRYDAAISNNLVAVPRYPGPELSDVHHIYPVLCDRRDELARYLEAHGVHTNIHYPVPAHHQECMPSLAGLTLPVAEHIHATELSLPISPAMTTTEADTVISLINSFK